VLSLCLLLCVTADLEVMVSGERFEIGQPIRCEVSLESLEGGSEALSLGGLEPGLAWIVAEEPAIHQSADGARSLSWTVFALEPDPGPLPLPSLESDGQPVALTAPSVAVASALAPGEDAPRPARGFYISELTLMDAPSLSLLLGVALALSLLFCLTISLALIVWFVLRRSDPRRAGPETLAERFARLGRTIDGDDPLVGDWHGELAQLLRVAHGDEQSGWSDEEWVERAELSAETRDELRALFDVCAAVRYGGARPTRFAVEETFERARALVAGAGEVAA